MKKTAALYFGLGAVAGSAVTALFFLFKEGLIWVGDDQQVIVEPTAKTDISKKEPEDEKPVLMTVEKASSNRVEYARLVAPYKSNIDQPVNEEQSDIHLSSEEEFFNAGRTQEYDVRALTLYSDRILADSVTDRVFTKLELPEIVGPYGFDYLLRWFESHDVLYICNEPLHTQYEITFDDRSYKEVTGR